MIYLFTGTPGSGKSLHASSILINRLNRKLTDRRVIANFEINEAYNTVSYTHLTLPTILLV